MKGDEERKKNNKKQYIFTQFFMFYFITKTKRNDIKLFLELVTLRMLLQQNTQ